MLWGVESRLLIFANWLPRSHREGPTARLCSGVPCCTTRFAPVTYLACLWGGGSDLGGHGGDAELCGGGLRLAMAYALTADEELLLPSLVLSVRKE